MSDVTTSNLRRAGANWARAKHKERAAMRDLETAVNAARQAGMSQERIAAVAGINRTTVLRALGIPPPSRRRKKNG